MSSRADNYLPFLLLSLVFALKHSHCEDCKFYGNANIEDLCFVSSHETIRFLSANISEISSEDIELKINDTTSGILDVKFPILRNYRDYTVQLFVHKDDKKECNTSEYVSHSERYFNIFSCKEDLGNMDCFYSVQPCTEFAVLKFFHVYSSCYYVQITPKIENRYGKPVTKYENLTSNYKKKLIAGEVPNVQFHPYAHTHTARVTITYSLVRELPVLLTLLKGVNLQDKEGCSKTGQRHSCCHLDVNEGPQCHLYGLKYDERLVPTCKIKNSRIECSFCNITYGDYCLIIEAIDDRCKKGTIWTEQNGACSFSYSLKYEKSTEHTTSIPDNSSSSMLLIILGTVTAVAFFLLIMGGFCFGVRHCYPPVGSMSPPLSSGSGCQPLVTSQPSILLLYAQDCQPFMDLMCSFRSFLSTVGRCEVLDCFDGACFEYVAPAPEDWMRRNVNSLRVVVVVSECSVEIQNRSYYTRQQYNYPLPYNHLFLVGLKEITSTASAHEYRRIFVVKFDNNDLSSLTPYTRYFLPNDLKPLLEHLNLMWNAENLDEYHESQILSKRIGEYLRYKRENPHYVNTLMALERIV